MSEPASPSAPAEVTFLPPALRPERPDFFVWWTGTLGQAEWLITHCDALAGNALPREVPHDLRALPKRLRPLLALEQPDLIVATAPGEPLLSIEITEQQEFGSNSQQRMARFWSAVACRVPSAYLLPIESYQLEGAGAGEAQILNERDRSLRDLRLFIAALPRPKALQRMTAAGLLAQGITCPADLLRAMNDGMLVLDRRPGPNASKLDALRDSIRRYVEQDPSDAVQHIQAVPFQEFLHDVNGVIYKAYVRKPGRTTSMVLSWLDRCSSQVPAYPFKAPSDLSALFETNGILHTLGDPAHPHLAFRNLPPGPGVGPVVHRRTGKDEISLFFEFISAVTTGAEVPDLARDLFCAPGEYFEPEIPTEWTKPLHSIPGLRAAGSGDFTANDVVTQELLRWAGVLPADQPQVLPGGRAHIFKIYCSAASRGLADPYSGMLAVRDVLFCREPEQLRHLGRFERTRGLVFLVEMRGPAASRHPFVYEQVNQTYRTLLRDGGAATPQQKVIELLEHCRAEDIPKNIRCHLAFSDLIIVRRISERGDSIEAVQGLPALLRSGLVSPQATFMRSLTL